MPRELAFSVTRKDFDVQTFRVGGNGGQHRDKTDAGVRIIHRASGARGEATDDRSQARNKATALHRLASSPVFRAWTADQISGLDQKVHQMMADEFLKVEVRQDGEWVEQ